MDKRAFKLHRTVLFVFRRDKNRVLGSKSDPTTTMVLTPVTGAVKSGSPR